MTDGASVAPRRVARSSRMAAGGPLPDSYKWIALSNTTLGVLLVSINESILIIALPAIFRGIRLNPLVPGNSFYLLWILLGFMLVTAVLVVTLGRIGDMYGRVRMYNLGFLIFTVFSVLLSVNWLHGRAAGAFIIAMRLGQGVGGSFLFANSSAILTDAFPQEQRGLALGINNIAGIAGTFIGLLVGGLLAPVDWRLVFIVSAPVGLAGTVWAYLRLRDNGVRTPARIDWWGNALFAIGLTVLLVGITYGIQPHGHHAMGWTSPKVLGELGAGVVLLAAFAIVESRIAHPMFHIDLFRIRAFLAGNIASLLAAIGRGGLMFVFVIWLQGIWLPLHGYNFSQTPLWAGIYMLPMTVGFLLAGPISGILSDRFGARPFATTGMIAAALTFVGFDFLPINFAYLPFALLMLANGLAMGLFASPNRAAIMNSLPPNQRGAGAGMAGVFQNAAMVLSMGIFFSLMISGIASSLPASLYQGLTAQHVPAAVAATVSNLPPITSLFSALLGYNPMGQLLGQSVLSQLPAHSAAVLSGRAFFPTLLTVPFSRGLNIAFTFGAIACVLAALASLLRGGKYVHGQEPAAAGASAAATAVAMPSLPQTRPQWAGISANGNGTPGLAHRGVDTVPSGTAAPFSSPAPAGATARGTAVADGPAAEGTPATHLEQPVGDGTPGFVAGGTVRDMFGQAIPGAVVTLAGMDGSQAGHGLADARGAYAIPGVDPGEYTLIVAAPGYAPSAETVRLTADRPAVRDVALCGSGALRGQVRAAADGVPIADATVSARDVGGQIVASIPTDGAGRFEFRGLGRGAYTLTASAARFRPEARQVHLPEGTHLRHEFSLLGTGRLEGMVRATPEGLPLAGMALSVTDQTGRVVAAVHTGADGRFAVPDLAEGEYTLVAAGYPPQALSVAVHPGEVREADIRFGATTAEDPLGLGEAAGTDSR